MSPIAVRAIDALKDYLDRVRFEQIYKNLATSALYSLTPSVATRRTDAQIARYFAVSGNSTPELRLLQCLLTGQATALNDLPLHDRDVARSIADAGLIGWSEDRRIITGKDFQLISAFGVRLLIDRNIHYGPRLHSVYIGPDSYAMLYYVDVADISRDSRVLDLCTGSGIAALYLSIFSDQVVATDIGDEPLLLAAYNRRLNGRDQRVELRRQDLRTSLCTDEQYDILTCNPPFVAMPASQPGTLYATGPGLDGLEYVRDIVSSLPHILRRNGVAYIVADLIGSRTGPHLVEELDISAQAEGLRINAFIDNVLPVSLQIDAMATFLGRSADDGNRQAIRDEVEDFYRSVLRAEYFYLTTLRITTRSADAGIRLFHRDSFPKSAPLPKWPSLLLSR